VADALVAAGPERLDPVRLASLQLDASGEPDVDRLVAGARAVLLSQPALALRFAERAAASSPGPKALVMMADAYAELGRPDEAERAHRRATAAVRTARDHLTVRMSELSFLTWTRRRPHEALDQLAALRATVPADDGPWVESTIALVTLFTARPAAALERAEAVLAGDPAPPRLDRIRASIVRLGALAMTGRTVDAVAASSELLAELDAGDVPPRTFGMGHVMAGLVGFIAWRDHVTRADPMSRWPVPPSDLARPGDAVRWPLLEGARRLVEGNVGVAVPLLREAAAQQRVGEGPFRSEAISQLIRGLVAAGHLDEAERLLADEPPDEVAVYPGLVSSCRAAIEAARGRPSAVDHAIAAAEQAEAVGAVVAAVAYAAEAARYGGVARAMAVIERLGDDFEVRPTSARAFAVRALAAGDPEALLDAAERYAAVGVWADAAALADSAAAGLRRDASGARARAVLLAQECRDKLGLASQAARAADALTRRELEVARLAVTGMSDRAIAETLVVSVRTAESHVAAIYRKLGITSRRALRELLAPQ
jgi:DNA-binding NarL/FixJ family response regulator